MNVEDWCCDWPVQSDLVLRPPDPEGLAPVAHRAGEHGLVDQVVLLLRQPGMDTFNRLYQMCNLVMHNLSKICIISFITYRHSRHSRAWSGDSGRHSASWPRAPPRGGLWAEPGEERQVRVMESPIMTGSLSDPNMGASLINQSEDPQTPALRLCWILCSFSLFCWTNKFWSLQPQYNPESRVHDDQGRRRNCESLDD